MAITDEQVARFKAENPTSELHLISNEELEVEIVVKIPNRGEWKRFRTMQADDGQKPMAVETLLLACLVHPDRDTFRDIVGAHPGIMESLGSELVKKSGISLQTTSRKL